MQVPKEQGLCVYLQNSMIPIMGTPYKVPLILGNSEMGVSRPQIDNKDTHMKYPEFTEAAKAPCDSPDGINMSLCSTLSSAFFGPYVGCALYSWGSIGLSKYEISLSLCLRASDLGPGAGLHRARRHHLPRRHEAGGGPNMGAVRGSHPSTVGAMSRIPKDSRAMESSQMHLKIMF